MSQINTITVNDGATPPAAVKFDVADRDGTSSNFRTSSAALVQGQKSFLHRATLAKNSRQANTTKVTLAYPVEIAVNGVTVVDSESTFTGTWNFSQKLTKEQRTAMYGLVLNLLSNADFKDQAIAVAPLS